MNLVAVHLIGPHIDSIRRLVASFSREDSCPPKVIDVIRNEESRATKSIHAARLQLKNSPTTINPKCCLDLLSKI